MPYSISGTTINVSGTVDLTNASLPPIYRINFSAGGTTATFNAHEFIAIPPQGISYTVVGSASQDVLTISLFEHGPPTPYGPPVQVELSPAMGFFSFSNWGANDVIVLEGNSDNNYLSGSYENEIFRGGNGDDTYDIGPGDIVDETGSGGIDTIRSYRSYSLLSARGDVENLVLTATKVDTSATGNALPNKLVGGLGNNILNGFAGEDVMQGRAGNDTYVVDTLNDIVDEGANNPGGLDRILSYVSYTLLDTVHVKGAVENLILIGAALEAEGNAYNNAITGNGLANIIEGLAGDDVLSGAAGVDQLHGGTGNDTYVLGSEASGVDKVVDGSGSADTITSLINRSLSFGDYSEIENLVLLGNAVSGAGNGLSNVVTGNAKGNALSGGNGNDKLLGGAGIDTLSGGANKDTFVFNTAPNSSTNRDIITDFNHVDDTFQLENAIFTKLGALAGAHMLNPAFFRAGATALDANDYLVYNKVTGNLFYDVNGSGAGGATLFATLLNKPVLAADDFVVI